MSAIRIQSLAKFIEHLFTVNCIEKTKINKKEAGNGQKKLSTPRWDKDIGGLKD